MDIAWGYAMSVEDVVGDDINLDREASDWEIGGLRQTFCSPGVNRKDYFALEMKAQRCDSPPPPALQLTLSKSIAPHPYSPKSHMNCSG